MSGKRVYVMLSVPRKSFKHYCLYGWKTWQIPGYPFQVLESLESAKKKCRVLNRDEPDCKNFVYFYKSLYSYPS